MGNLLLLHLLFAFDIYTEPSPQHTVDDTTEEECDRRRSQDDDVVRH